MDAKPQRLRAFRMYDENMPPPALPAKTLHQRTKSVPAFSTLQNGAAKTVMAINTVITNKKVLGEVNPNLKVKQTAKDDLVVGKKTDAAQIQKVAHWRQPTAASDEAQQAVKETAPLARPALRPQPAKSFSALTNSSSAKSAAASEADAVKAPTVKKSMPILRDTSDATSTQNGASVTTASELPQAEVIDLVSLDMTVNKYPEQQQPQQTSHHETLSNVVVLAAPQVKAQSIEQTQQPSNLPSGFTSEKDFTIDLEKQAQYIRSKKVHLHSVLPPFAPVVEMPAQQYYEEEAEYEYFDDGYTTARSFGLPGDSTGGFTTVLAPKPTEKTKLEVDAAKRYVESVRTPEDVDDELWDTSMVAEYGDEIFEYMRKLEDRMRPDPRYMDIQQEIQWSMRAVLVDWVVQVHQRFTLLPETLFLAVNYIDRFLSNKVVSLGKLQLVGATALFIAAKFEEVNCPTLQEVIFMVDGGYTMDELLKAERFMLSMLQFDLGWPGPMSFLRRISKADDYDLETRTLAKYFLEVTIMDERFIGCTPSYLAAGAHCLSRLMLRKGDWSVAHVAYSEYTYAQLRPLLLGITECCDNPRRHHLSVYEKYTDKRYKRASTFVEAEMLKGFTLQSRLSVRSSFGPAAMALNSFV